MLLKKKEATVSNQQNVPAQTETAIGNPLPHSLLGILREIFKKYRHSRQLRKSQRDARTAFLPILRMDDQMLEDIGITREEAQWAAGLPLEVNAAKAMHARARNRRRDEASQPRLGSARSCATTKERSVSSVIAPHPASMHRQRAKPCRLWGPSGRDSAQAV